MKSSGSSLSIILAALILAGSPAIHAQVDAPQTGAPPKVSAPSAPGNALAFETTLHNYGVISEGETVDVVFPVRNTTDKRINITRIQVSCGCTQAKDNPEFIEPGATAEIKVQYNSTGRPGRSSKSVSIFTDEGEGGGLYQLTFTGEARQINYLTERVINFGEINNGEGASYTIDFVSLSEPPVTIRAANVGDQQITATVGETVKEMIDGKPGTRTPITVTVPKDFPVRSFSSVLMVDTDDAKRSRVTAPVSGSVQGRFTPTPRRIQMGRMNPGDSLERQASIVMKDNQPFEIVSVTAGDASSRFVVTERPTGNDGTRTLVVSFKAPENNGVFSSVVEVLAKAGDYEELIKIPVTAQVMNPTEAAGPQRPAGPPQTSQAPRQITPRNQPQPARPVSTP